VPRLLISDLDGTIADTAPAIFEALHLTCAAVGVELSRDADLSFALGPPLHESLASLGVDDERMADAIAVFETAHTELIDLVVPMPGAETVLPQLAAAGVTIAVATIKPEPIAALVLETIGLHRCVHALHGRAGDMDPRTKTDLVRAAAGDRRDDAVYTGDHDNDAAAAAALGIPFYPYTPTSWLQIRDALVARADVP
jgi:phosphoglycolate phosphatase-like HAD superfamily hydrolase